MLKGSLGISLQRVSGGQRVSDVLRLRTHLIGLAQVLNGCIQVAVIKFSHPEGVALLERLWGWHRASHLLVAQTQVKLGAVRNLWKHVGRQLLKDRLGLSKAPSVEEPSGRLKMLYCRNILRIRALLGRYGLGCRGRVARTAPASGRVRTSVRARSGSGAGSFSRLTPSAGA